MYLCINDNVLKIVNNLAPRLSPNEVNIIRILGQSFK